MKTLRYIVWCRKEQKTHDNIMHIKFNTYKHLDEYGLDDMHLTLVLIRRTINEKLNENILEEKNIRIL